jgi:hypothetical protein
MFSTTLAILATLLAPFALIVGAVVSVMRRTEDDELLDAINRNMNAPTEPLGEWLALLRDEARA